MKELRVVELFAGVGGFRLGLEKNKIFKTVWANQWEPSSKNQFAFSIYSKRFNKGVNSYSNKDINEVPLTKIPNHDLLVGGFPCQDYSVARTNAKGIVGKKGVLWWNIYNIAKFRKPTYILLENVDRLIKSPTKQRGRDFAIILKSLNDLGYQVEWRIINAAKYGMQQRRRRIFIFAFKTRKKNFLESEANKILFSEGIFAKSFPIKNAKLDKEMFLKYDLVDISDNWNKPFKSSGILRNNILYQVDGKEVEKDAILLQDLLENNVDSKFYLNEKQIKKIEEMKSSKKIKRKKPNGEIYFYTEGKMNLYDMLDKPARTMLTSEGTLNRSSHFIKDLETQRGRRITPVEAERINGFPDNWTKGLTDRQRYFCMGNALVVDVIKKLGEEIQKIELNKKYK